MYRLNVLVETRCFHIFKEFTIVGQCLVRLGKGTSITCTNNFENNKVNKCLRKKLVLINRFITHIVTGSIAFSCYFFLSLVHLVYILT